MCCGHVITNPPSFLLYSRNRIPASSSSIIISPTKHICHARPITWPPFKPTFSYRHRIGAESMRQNALASRIGKAHPSTNRTVLGSVIGIDTRGRETWTCSYLRGMIVLKHRCMVCGMICVHLLARSCVVVSFQSVRSWGKRWISLFARAKTNMSRVNSRIGWRWLRFKYIYTFLPLRRIYNYNQ
jgi:hypothetical protein